MRLARALLRAVDRELSFIKRRGGSHVHVDAQHTAANELTATVKSSLDGEVELRRFVCWERHADRSPTRRIVYARPETKILVRVA